MSRATRSVNPPQRHRGLLLVVAAVLGCGLAIAACGSSSKPDAPHKSQFLAFSQCMRTHGVTNFPDPSAGGGIHIQLGSGLNPFSPSFKAAQKACFKLLPGGGPFNHKPSAQDEHQMLAVSVCMRSHGVTGFPDPTTTPPSGPGSFALVIGRDGVFVEVPKTIDVNSPAYQKAAQACNFPGAPPPKSK